MQRCWRRRTLKWRSLRIVAVTWLICDVFVLALNSSRGPSPYGIFWFVWLLKQGYAPAMKSYLHMLKRQAVYDAKKLLNWDTWALVYAVYEVRQFNISILFYSPSPSKSIVTLIHFVLFQEKFSRLKAVPYGSLTYQSSCPDLLGWKGLQEVDLGLRVYGQVVWRRKDHSGNVCGPQERRLTSEGDVRCCRRLSGEQHHRPGTGKVPCDVQTFL